MPKILKVNKEKCIACGVCWVTCPEGSCQDADGKAKIIDSEKMEVCGGVAVCPYEAIEEEK